jgi:transcriptional regulator with XRE-family HTH domain
MRRESSGTSISQAVVEHLRGQGRTLAEIGEMVGLSESFLSRVASGQRSFTLEHLERFEQRLGQPLPALLLEAEWRDAVPEERRGEFEEMLSLLRELGGMRAALGAEGDDENAGQAKPGPSGRERPPRRAVG